MKLNAFIEPPSDAEGGNGKDGQPPLKKSTRQVNVYDAVAGK